MATEPENAMDYKHHEKSYSLFAAIMKWGTIVSVVTTAIVVLLISN
ncbi:aa3-type cytochrome c oxidase subunit IV [Sphingomonas sp. LY54]|nr:MULTISPECIES: aa3-type cytochrome c oxidase subunit IV [Sphingomonadales]MEA1014839.1 aa3-type cytochrome c oxidase subunit IV [Sphingosinicella sp. LY1275]WRP29570.1 aa3-type cytochrome c oxidase subunit IV [Sphingomonas sp. LY54]